MTNQNSLVGNGSNNNTTYCFAKPGHTYVIYRRSGQVDLDRLARRSLVGVRTVTPLPRTLPAVASVMTGALPHTHGVRDNFHYSLGPGAVTLAERLRDAGWATAAVNSNPVLSHASGEIVRRVTLLK